MNKNVKLLLDDLSKIPEVEAILLAGSHSTGTNDENSDYDIYIYSKTEIPKEKRVPILNKYFKYIEISNKYWEEEDDGILHDNTEVELIYRNIDFIEGSLQRTLIDCQADIGYTTCFWSNIKNSIIIYDKNEELTKIKNKYNIDYPDNLKNNIIEKNYGLLKDKFPAYYSQIEKALKRNDYISVNHRIAAFFASYFDIIFAYNKFPHPGEKKILKIMKENNLTVPNNMEQNVLSILNDSGMNNSRLLNEINELIKNLDELIFNK